MKAFIIHINHQSSIEYAQAALNSFSGFKGWEPELFEGVALDTLPKYEKLYPLKTKSPSRAEDFFKKNKKKYQIKKCCSMNHYRLFNKCVELNEPIAVVEHDSHCVGDWEDFDFQDILVMNAASAIKQKTLKPVWKINQHPIEQGVHDINFNGLRYKFDYGGVGEISDLPHIMPGTAAYAVTPKGARKMIEVYETKGWEQSDFIINTGHVRIQTIMPELFTFELPNLSMSHGRHI